MDLEVPLGEKTKNPHIQMWISLSKDQILTSFCQLLFICQLFVHFPQKVIIVISRKVSKHSILPLLYYSFHVCAFYSYGLDNFITYIFHALNFSLALFE